MNETKNTRVFKLNYLGLSIDNSLSWISQVQNYLHYWLDCRAFSKECKNKQINKLSACFITVSYTANPLRHYSSTLIKQGYFNKTFPEYIQINLLNY